MIIIINISWYAIDAINTGERPSQKRIEQRKRLTAYDNGAFKEET